MRGPNYKLIFTVLMAATAGNCDGVTFSAGNGILSAHITGNLVLAAQDILIRNDRRGWLRLLTLPAFAVATGFGGWLGQKPAKENVFLLLEAVTLAFASWIAYAFKDSRIVIIIVLLATVAMGLQNAFQRVFADEVDETTTMMTGNTVQLIIDIGLLSSARLDRSYERIKKGCWVLIGFLVGCFCGIALAKVMQLSALLFGAATMFTAYCTRVYEHS
jgi:uncharacterized membrane protein YoaK (UPF0700 family)